MVFIFGLFGTSSQNGLGILDRTSTGIIENAVIIGMTGRIIQLNKERVDIATTALNIQKMNKENNVKNYELNVKNSEINQESNKLMIQLLESLNYKFDVMISRNEEILNILKKLGGD